MYGRSYAQFLSGAQIFSPFGKCAPQILVVSASFFKVAFLVIGRTYFTLLKVELVKIV